MSVKRIYNFNAGPAALPLPVLEEIQASLLDYGGSGMSVTEISHRSKWFDDIINDAIARTKRLMHLADDHRVPVSYTHLTLPTSAVACRSRGAPYH